MKRMQYFAELWQDITFTTRQLLKNRSFAAIAILTLALGIGGTTAIFSALYAVVLQPIALREPERLLLVAETFQGMPADASVGNYTDANRGVTAFEAMSAMRFSSLNFSDGRTPERIVGARVTANYFDVMGVRPQIGRVFTTDEDRPGSETVAVLSHRLWTRRFGSSAAIIGQTIRMSGATYTVVGVMPASFDLTTDSEELWVPIAFTPQQKATHDEHYLAVYGRLKPGATREQAKAELDAVAARLRREFPQDDGELIFSVVPFRDQFVGDYRQRLLVLLAAVSVVLLIACGNVANLLLARGAARAREIAVRTALGAGQWRIVRQLLTESGGLAFIAAAARLLPGKRSVTAGMALPQATYTDPARVADTFRRITSDVAVVPGVSHAAVSSYAAMGPGGNTNGLLPEGVPFSVQNLIPSRLRIITPEFFQTMRIPILKGRNFDATDRTGGQKVMIISAALAARAFPGQDPIGKRMGCCERTPSGGADLKLVIGVAGCVHSPGPAEPPAAEFYLPLAQAPADAWIWIQRVMYIVARTDGDPSSLLPSIRATIPRVDPHVPLYDVRPMSQRLVNAMATARFNTLLLSILGGIGLLLAASGIYG